MKTIRKTIASLCLLAFGLTAVFAGNLHGNETKTFKVYGNCSMCKKRIESALKTKGVSSASWNVESKVLTVSYDPQVISLDEIHQKVAAVGHDTEKVKAEDKAYSNLMGCCQYSRTGANKKDSSHAGHSH